MRSKLVGVAVALLAAGGAASAADLAPAYPSVPWEPAYSWTGFYAGANVGYGWANVAGSAVFGGATGTTSERIAGAVGGGQIGFNWQIRNVVLGLETDIQASGQNKTANGSLFGIGFVETNKVGYFGTVRGRLGVAFDRWMPYVTGGFGYGNFSYVNTNPLGTFKASHHTAWVVGAGIEAVIAGPWSAKVEYLYLDTGNFTDTFPTAAGPVRVTSRTKDNIVRLGLNYRF